MRQGAAPNQAVAKVRLHNGLPFLLYGVAYVLGRSFGYGQLTIPWHYFQLLDRQALIERPLSALYLLHAQPPLLNGLLAGLLRLAPDEETLAFLSSSLFFLLGLLAAVALYRAVFELVGTPLPAAAVLALTLANPAYYFFQHLFFYPFLLYTLLSCFLLAAVGTLRRGRARTLAVAALLLALICNSRSLFHPLWALSLYAILAAATWAIHRWPSRAGMKKVSAISALLITAVTLWPLKNGLLYGTFTFSTWEGYNLALESGADDPMLEAYLANGSVPPEMEAVLDRFQEEHGLSDEAMRVIAAPQKSSGGRNWNHLLFAASGEALTVEALAYRARHPGEWLETAGAQYLAWSRPSYIHPYEGTVRGPGNRWYQGYAAAHQALFFPDLRPLLGPPLVAADGTPRLFLAGLPLPLTLFAVAGFPLVMGASLLLAGSYWRQRRMASAVTILLVWLTLAWLVAVPSLTDGWEGNRMRFAGTPYLMLLLVLLLESLYAARRRPEMK